MTISRIVFTVLPPNDNSLYPETTCDFRVDGVNGIALQTFSEGSFTIDFKGEQREMFEIEVPDHFRLAYLTVTTQVVGDIMPPELVPKEVPEEKNLGLFNPRMSQQVQVQFKDYEEIRAGQEWVRHWRQVLPPQ